MGIYMENGFLDWSYIMNSEIPWWIIIGGRAIGKTYGGMAWPLEHGQKMIYMRRTQKQADLAGNPKFSPFRDYNNNTGREITVRPLVQGISEIIELSPDGEQIGDNYGYTVALSTISNIRGIGGLTESHMLLYDEFIPEAHERPIKEEAAAFFNAVETIGRNRELQGHDPLKVVLLSNSNKIDSPILAELGLIRRIDRMQRKGVELWQDNKRGIAIMLPHDSPITQAKQQTSLYKITAGTDFARMALNNEFATEDFSRTESRDLHQFRPLVTVGELTIYKSKVAREWYCSLHRFGNPPTYGAGMIEMQRFRMAHGDLITKYLENKIIFEEHICEVLFRRYLAT